MERKLQGKNLETFGYASRGCPRFGHFEKSCFVHYWKLPKIQTGSLGRMESDQYAYPSLPCFLAIFGQIFFSSYRGALYFRWSLVYF